MNVRTVPVRKTIAATSLVLCGLMAGGTLVTAGTASAASTPSSSSSSTAAKSADTAVTGAEADKVIAAVKAKYPTSTITTVRKDPDGSYDAIGTDASGTKVFYDVSADLATITAGGGHGGKGGHGGARGASQDTAATAAEAASVKAAVKAKYATSTITTVRKDADGSFDAIGTDASGNKVFYDVSADYKTVTAHAAHAGKKAAASSPTTTTS